MIINNKFYRLMEADAGDGNGGEGVEQPTEQPTEVKTYTQEEYDKATKKLETDLRAKLEKEYQDKLKTDIETAISEKERYEKLTDKEKAEEDYKKRLEALEKREKEATIRELQSCAIKTLSNSEYGYDGESIESLLGLLNYESAETLDTSIKNIHGVINKIVEAEVKKLAKTTTSPTVSNSNGNTIGGFKFNFTGVRKH